MNSAQRHPNLWLIYLALSVAGAGMSVLAGLAASFAGNGSVQSAIGAVFSVIALAPLFGFVRQRKVGERWLSWLLLAVSVVASVSIAAILLFTTVQHGLSLKLVLGLLALAFTGPYLYAVYQYVCHSSHIWRPET